MSFRSAFNSAFAPAFRSSYNADVGVGVIYAPVLDYSTSVGPLTIVDQSGFGNTATLYSGRGLTMDAVNDSVTYATGYGGGESLTATVWMRVTSLGARTLNSAGASFNFTPTATNVWEQLSSTTNPLANLTWTAGSDCDIGDLVIGTEHWTHNDWSDPTGDTSNGKTIVDSGPNQLHGTCTGCSGFTGEATIPQTVDKNWNMYENLIRYSTNPKNTATWTVNSAYNNAGDVSVTLPNGSTGNAFHFKKSSGAGRRIDTTLGLGITHVFLYVRGGDYGTTRDTFSARNSTGISKLSGVGSTSFTSIGGVSTITGLSATSWTLIRVAYTSRSFQMHPSFGSETASCYLYQLEGKTSSIYSELYYATGAYYINGWLVSASDANDQIDAFGNAISEPRLNTQQLNLFGDGEYSRTPDSASLDLTTTATWEVWGNFYGTVDVNSYFFSKYQSSGDERSWTLLKNASDGSTALRVNFGSATGAFAGFALWNALSDKIQHVVITYSSGTMNLYLDGSLVGAPTVVGSIPTSIYVGTAPVTQGSLEGSFALGNKIGSAKIYNVALTAGRVQTYFNDQKSLYGL
tara:strand:- start:295 stop:2019 length:1725 start_codon:yes stop_codon:yes gene_type:complete